MPIRRKKGSDTPSVKQSGHNLPAQDLGELGEYLKKQRAEAVQRRSQRAIQPELPMGQAKLVVCRDCGGTGHDKKGKRCGECNGQGVKESLHETVGDPSERPQVECPKCLGVGEVASPDFTVSLCRLCFGNGKVDAR
jgi:hypothetical protein